MLEKPFDNKYLETKKYKSKGGGIQQTKAKSDILDRSPKRGSETVGTPINFLKKFKNRNDAAIIFLKGGRLGGLNLDVKARIINQLSRWFRIIEGRKHNPTFEEIAVRWGSTGLQYQFNKMEKNFKFKEEFINKGRKFLSRKNKEGFFRWFANAQTISENDAGLLRQKLILDYFSEKGQLLLLKLKKGISRETILRDLNLNKRESLAQAVGEKKADLHWANPKVINFQDFVKRIIIGETASYKAAPGTVRYIVAQELNTGALKEIMAKAMGLKKRNSKVWQVELGDYNSPEDDEETVISTFLNAVHSVDLSLDEFKLITKFEIKKFSKILKD